MPLTFSLGLLLFIVAFKSLARATTTHLSGEPEPPSPAVDAGGDDGPNSPA